MGNQPNLWKSKIETSKVSPPMPPLSKEKLSYFARVEIDDLQRLVAALIDAQDLLVARVDYLETSLKLRGLI